MANPDPDFPAGDFPAPEGSGKTFRHWDVRHSDIFCSIRHSDIFCTIRHSDRKRWPDSIRNFKANEQISTAARLNHPDSNDSSPVGSDNEYSTDKSATESADRCEPSFLPPRLISVDRLINQKLYVNSSEFA
uniref:Uncharacterized protein n=1 Tax=Globodera rostochiensis TaxID=31243 RepID=A0A914GY13_GLORO